GRVATSAGNGISNVIVTLSDPSGTTQTAVTNSFGNFRFQGVQAGQAYLAAARSKKYQFAEPTQTVYVGGEVTDLAFIP
ncbi:MAG: carboxypeptidase-like regulatory domain-containing protein, partial [Acidobacteriota bacterium]